MTRFLMPLRESVALVQYAFEHARQGDMFIKKAAAATLADLIAAIKDLFGVPDHPVKVIGWRHAEKLYETLASSQEIGSAEDLGEYYRLVLDSRDLHYNAYFSEGNEALHEFSDFHSHNTRQLNVEEVKALLLTLPEVEEQLRIWNGRHA